MRKEQVSKMNEKLVKVIIGLIDDMDEDLMGFYNWWQENRDYVFPKPVRSSDMRAIRRYIQDFRWIKAELEKVIVPPKESDGCPYCRTPPNEHCSCIPQNDSLPQSKTMTTSSVTYACGSGVYCGKDGCDLNHNCLSKQLEPFIDEIGKAEDIVLEKLGEQLRKRDSLPRTKKYFVKCNINGVVFESDSASEAKQWALDHVAEYDSLTVGVKQ